MTSWWRLEASAFSSGDARRGIGTTGVDSRDGGASAGVGGRSTISSEPRVLAGDLDGRKVRGMRGRERLVGYGDGDAASNPYLSGRYKK